MSRALISSAGTGAFEGVAGVKTAKLCAEQDQIGKHVFCEENKMPPASGFRVDRKRFSAMSVVRGMIVTLEVLIGFRETESGLRKSSS